MNKTILELSNTEARKYFLEAKNYCTLDLPEYINFQPLLDDLDMQMSLLSIDNNAIWKLKPGDVENTSYEILSNKDGNYQWRPISIIHPVLYINLVNIITDEDNWKIIVDRFETLLNDSHIYCCSIPTIKFKKKNIVSNWYENFEQFTIENYINYQWMAKTDISNFYSSIYTHTISWAIVGKDKAKRNKNKHNELYNVIDKCIQGMQYNQTNGIPQGSVLMDFIAELVLAYADYLVTQKIEIKDYLIIRYRDDYRILTKNKNDAETILKELSIVLSDLNLKLNSNKTIITDDIILDALKPEKIHLNVCPVNTKTTFKKRLLNILVFEKKFPNNSQTIKLLNEILRKLKKYKSISNIPQLLSINTQLMLNYPKNYKSCVAIFSVIFSKMSEQEVLEYIDRIIDKNSERPYSDYLEIWLQRITLPYCRNKKYHANICKKIAGEDIDVWDSSWTKLSNLKIDEKLYIDEEKISKLDKIISQKEIDDFNEY